MILYGLEQPLNGGILELVLNGDHSLAGTHLELLGYQVTLIELYNGLVVIFDHLLDDLLGQLQLIFKLLLKHVVQIIKVLFLDVSRQGRRHDMTYKVTT
jgi:hypothetical protein